MIPRLKVTKLIRYFAFLCISLSVDDMFTKINHVNLFYWLKENNSESKKCGQYPQDMNGRDSWKWKFPCISPHNKRSIRRDLERAFSAFWSRVNWSENKTYWQSREWWSGLVVRIVVQYGPGPVSFSLFWELMELACGTAGLSLVEIQQLLWHGFDAVMSNKKHTNC